MTLRLPPDPQPVDLTLPWFIPSVETQLERDRILASRYFLVKIAGNGDVWRCRRCNTKHRYLTLMCVEQPFSGLTRGLYAYWHTVGINGAENFMTPGQRARFERLADLLGPQPDLATQHPQTARRLAVSERDADAGAIAIGLLEPITAKKAQELGRRINSRGIKPPFTLPGLEV